MATVLKKLPGVLSFQRGTLVSDALFYSLMPDGQVKPLHITRHGIRGTQNINKLETNAGSTATSAKRENPANIQTTDSAKLDPRAVALQVRFDIRFLPIDQLLFACAPSQEDKPEDIVTMRSNYASFIERAKGGEGLREVARRYARNIANGRFLWRNRTVARSITVSVQGSGLDASFDALSIDLNRFEAYSEDEQRMAEVIRGGMCGDREAKLSVRAEVDFGVRGAVEVFPSQNYLEDKGKGFARPLYGVGEWPAAEDRHTVRTLGQAALREQKVANALRTFDTWYPAFAERQLPIPIEPNGANLDAQQFFRNNKESSGFAMLLRLGDLDPDSPDGMFVTSCLIRGGVFSGSDKKKEKTA